MTFQAIILPNKQAFDGLQLSVWNFYEARYREKMGITSKYANDWVGKDGKYLLPINNTVSDFPFSPHQIVQITVGDSNWFNTEEL